MRMVQGAAPGASLAENWAFMRDNFHGHTPASVHAENVMRQFDATADDAARPAHAPDYSGVSGKVSQLSPQERFYREQTRVAVALGCIPAPDTGEREPVARDTRTQEMAMRAAQSTGLTVEQYRLRAQQRKAEFDRLEQFEPNVPWTHRDHKQWVNDRVRAMLVMSQAALDYENAQR